MPFPFFRLPFELRYIIYQYLFTPEYRNSLNAPDVGRLSRAMRLNRPEIGPWRSIITLNCQALPLMRTCQQAHDESTSVLYGNNTFCFDDIPYDEEDFYWSLNSSDFYPPHYEIFHFYPFLSVIGRANRMKLRHLDLKIYTYTIFAVPGEGTVWNSKYKSDLSATSSIINALDFLSESHRLQSLVLHFQGSYWGMARFSLWFSKDCELYRSLTQFKAISELKCCVGMDGLYELDDAKDAAYEEAVDNYHELRAELAAAYALESERIDSSSTKNGFQSDPISQFGASI